MQEGNPVCTKVTGEQLCVQDDHAHDAWDVTSELGHTASEGRGDGGTLARVIGCAQKESAEVVCMVSIGSCPTGSKVPASTPACAEVGDSGVVRPKQTNSGSHPCSQPPTGKGDDATELCMAQKKPSDVGTIYSAVSSQKELTQAEVGLGSSELKKFSSLFSLMRIREDGMLVVRIIVNSRPREVIVCPTQLRKEVMWATHVLSHAGIMKTLNRVRLTWYWPGMTSDIRRLVKTCEICQKAKSGGLRQPSTQGPLWVGRPWQKVAVDLVGPLPVTPRGNKWIMVLTDHFTRWQDALPLTDATAPVVAEMLDARVFSYFGIPEELHSDRGAQFEGDLITELCSWWGITKTRTTPYHPQSNGVVERGNRTLGDALRSMLLSCAHQQDSWDFLLPQLMRAFRATPHSKTGETANYLMLGRECRLPDQLRGGTYSREFTARSTYAQQLKERMEAAHDLLRSQQMLPLRSADEDDALFIPGDVVLVQRKHKKKGVNPKLQPKFDGPFVVKKAFGNGTYKVEGRGTVNESRLKLFTPCSDHQGQPKEQFQESTGEELDTGVEVEFDKSLSSPFIPVNQESNLSVDGEDQEQQATTSGRPARQKSRPAYLRDYVVY